MSSWYHTWTKYRLKDVGKDIPEHSHFAVMVIKDQQYTTRGYDRDDPDDTHTVKVFDYYAFTKKAEWEKMISDIYTDRHTSRPSYGQPVEDIVFFQSAGRGKVDVKINVNVAVQGDDGTNPMHGFGHGRGD